AVHRERGRRPSERTFLVQVFASSEGPPVPHTVRAGLRPASREWFARSANPTSKKVGVLEPFERAELLLDLRRSGARAVAHAMVGDDDRDGVFVEGAADAIAVVVRIRVERG